MFLNKVPVKVIIGLMNSTNYNGSLKHYPYAYEKFGVTRVRQRIDGEYPYRALELTGNSKAEDLVVAFSQRLALTSTTGCPFCSQATGDKVTIVPCSCLTMLQGMLTILAIEILNSRGMSAMKLTSQPM